MIELTAGVKAHIDYFEVTMPNGDKVRYKPEQTQGQPAEHVSVLVTTTFSPSLTNLTKDAAPISDMRRFLLHVGYAIHEGIAWSDGTVDLHGGSDERVLCYPSLEELLKRNFVDSAAVQWLDDPEP